MQVFRGLPNSQARSPCALTIGNFDGVHRGHQALLRELVDAARQLRLPAAVMTFEPHPREYFAARTGDAHLAPTRIANLRDKLEALRACGVDRVIVEHFNEHFAAQSPAEFIDNVLRDGCHARWLCVGDDFRFGAKRAGDLAYLRSRARDIDIVSLSAVHSQAGERISSSAVRTALAAADFRQAAELLGRPYMMSGRVIHGRKLGRTLGFPTLNLRVTHRRPATQGVFAVRVHGLNAAPLPGVASLGVRPTIEDAGQVLLETHLFDWAGDAYGHLVRIEFIAKLRDEQRYASLAELTTAIDDDARRARAVLAVTPRHPSA